MFHLLLRRVGLGVVAACAMVAAACTGGGYEKLPETGASLEGTAKYGDEKMLAGLVIVAGKGGSATGNIDESTGRYKIENVPVGEVKIAISTDAAKGEMMGKMMSGYYKGPDAKAKGRLAPPKIVEVPKKYQNPDTSGLTTTINQGPNTFDLVIPKK